MSQPTMPRNAGGSPSSKDRIQWGPVLGRGDRPYRRKSSFIDPGEGALGTRRIALFLAGRRNIEQLQRGEPNYEQMSPQLADITRQQLPQLKGAMTQLGASQSVTFTGVGPGGADIYQGKFEHGTTEWRIMLGDDGKAVSIGFRPI